jgi:3-oxoacyl-[acyl-carrier protein] reductase
MKYLALELALDNIRVNNVLPGWVAGARAEARMREEAQRQSVAVADLLAEECAPIPMKRFAEAREIGEAIAFLASDRASYITGVNLRIDGGWCLNPVT